MHHPQQHGRPIGPPPGFGGPPPPPGYGGGPHLLQQHQQHHRYPPPGMHSPPPPPPPIAPPAHMAALFGGGGGGGGGGNAPTASPGRVLTAEEVEASQRAHAAAAASASAPASGALPSGLHYPPYPPPHQHAHYPPQQHQHQHRPPPPGWPPQHGGPPPGWPGEDGGGGGRGGPPPPAWGGGPPPLLPGTPPGGLRPAANMLPPPGQAPGPRQAPYPLHHQQQQHPPPPLPPPLPIPTVAAKTPPPVRARVGFRPGARPKCDMAALDEELVALVETVRPTPDEVAARDAALEAVTEVLTAIWPAAKVELFGSCANGLSVAAANDIDVCLVLPPGVADDTPGKAVAVEAAAAALAGAGFTDMLALPRARVPVVKCVAPPRLGGTKVDVTVNNALALLNTRLLATYVALDPRLGQLCHVIKHWAKRRSVNDPYRGTLSSYAYVLMCIHLLQTRSPPILPILQGGQGVPPPTVKTAVGVWAVEYCDDVSALKGFGAHNKETLADLVWSFFEYWAWRHDYSGSVISVRLGGWLTKAQKDWTRRQGNERHLLGIEDPFEVAHDLGRTIDRATAGVLQKEFERAGGLLREHAGAGGAARLMEPYRAGNG